MSSALASCVGGIVAQLLSYDSVVGTIHDHRPVGINTRVVYSDIKSHYKTG